MPTILKRGIVWLGGGAVAFALTLVPAIATSPPHSPNAPVLQQTDTSQQNQAGTAPAAQTGQTAGQGDLNARINQALLNDPQLSKYAISASVDEKGKVTLNGTVPNKEMKKHAQETVKNVPGVEKVKNEIAVNPSVTPMEGQQPSAQPSGQQPGQEQQQQPPAEQQPQQQQPEQQPQGQPPAATTPEQQQQQQPGMEQQPSEQQPGQEQQQPPAEQQPQQQQPEQQPQGQPPAATTPEQQQQQQPGMEQQPSEQQPGQEQQQQPPAEQQPQQQQPEQQPQGQPPAATTPEQQQQQQPGAEQQPSEQQPGQEQQQQPPAEQQQQPQQQPPAAQPSGSALQSQIANALKADPALSGVSATVSGTTVTLSGDVASEADKATAERTVLEVSPTSTIQDQIKVKQPSQPPPDAGQQATPPPR